MSNLRRPIATLVCIGMIVCAVSAKEAPKENNRVLVRVETVRPEFVSEYEDLVKNELLPAVKKGGLKAQETWTTAALGSFYRYMYIHPMDSFAAFDALSPAEKAIGREATLRLISKLRRCVHSVEYFVMERRSELTHGQPISGEPKLLLIAEYRISPGKLLEFEELIKTEFIPKAEQNSNAAFETYQKLVGGDPNTYFLMLPLPNFAQLDKGHFIDRSSSKGPRQLTDKGAGIVSTVDVTVYRFVSDLSYK